MDILLIVIVVGTTLGIQHVLVRRKLNKLGEKIDAVIACFPERDLDFFRSNRMKEHLTNLGLIDVLCAKADKIRQSMPCRTSQQNEEIPAETDHTSNSHLSHR